MKLEEDFTNIYNNYSTKVFRLCLGYASGNRDLASDWLQETFIKVWKHRHSFKGKSTLDTWIYRIAVNTCLSDLRQSKKDLHLNENHLVKTTTEDEDVDNKTKNIKKMYQCIEQLSKQNRALILMELEDIPQVTIAETLGLAHGTLRTRLSRIRKSLLKCITNGK